MRERIRKFGIYLNKIFLSFFYNKINNYKIVNIFSNYLSLLIRPFNVFLECITGLFEGIENKQPIILLAENIVHDNNSITDDTLKYITVNQIYTNNNPSKNEIIHNISNMNLENIINPHTLNNENINELVNDKDNISEINDKSEENDNNNSNEYNDDNDNNSSEEVVNSLNDDDGSNDDSDDDSDDNSSSSSEEDNGISDKRVIRRRPKIRLARRKR
tara:strand:- start:464 stop:1114 length:651 start_codon:yes stop_codon:yes gene_type:complete